MKSISRICHSEYGFILPVGMMFLAILAIICITGYFVITADLKIGDNYKNNSIALQNAEAGVNYIVRKIENGLLDASFDLPENVGDSVVLSSFGVPDGFSFVISDLTKTGGNAYSFTSTGTSGGDTKAQYSVQCKQGAAIVYAAFGDLLVDMKSASQVYSYDSGTNPNPTPIDSTGNGHIGSNGTVSVKMNTTVDGDVALGDDGGGNEAVYRSAGTPIITGIAGEDVDRVDPDPLGILGGEFANRMADVAINNDNAVIGIGTSPSISGTWTLPPGNYYFVSLTLRNGAVLDIQASGDEQVRIWLAGPMEAKNGSAINLTGKPTNFAIFSNSASSIVLKHGSHHKGLVYAPYATVEMKNSGNLYGAVWAKTADLKNSAIIYYDEALQDEYQSKAFLLTSLREKFD